MKTLKVTTKQCLLPVAVVCGLHLMSYFPARSMVIQPATSTLRDIGDDDEGDKAFKTKIFFVKGKSANTADPSADFRRLIDYYGG